MASAVVGKKAPGDGDASAAPPPPSAPPAPTDDSFAAAAPSAPPLPAAAVAASSAPSTDVPAATAVSPSASAAAAAKGKAAWGALRSAWMVGASKVRAGVGAAMSTSRGNAQPEGPEVGGVGGAAAAAPDGVGDGVGDVEDGTGERTGLLSGTPALPSAVSGGLASFKGFMSKSLDRVKSSVGKGPTNADGQATPSSTDTDDGYCGLSRMQRIQGFVILLFSGLVLLSIAVFVFLPVAILMPSKFALSFTMGSVCIMAAFAAYNGPRNFARNLMARERLGFTAAYLFSIGFTLYSALFVGSYFLVLIAAVGQIAALMWYTATFFPYGRTGMKMLTRFCSTGFKRVVWPCLKGTARVCSGGSS